MLCGLWFQLYCKQPAQQWKTFQSWTRQQAVPIHLPDLSIYCYVLESLRCLLGMTLCHELGGICICTFCAQVLAEHDTSMVLMHDHMSSMLNLTGSSSGVYVVTCAHASVLLNASRLYATKTYMHLSSVRKANICLQRHLPLTIATADNGRLGSRMIAGNLDLRIDCNTQQCQTHGFMLNVNWHCR